MSSPSVSIVITAYNVAPFIRATVDAALAQEQCDCEVIVVDDGSTDGTRELLAAYGDSIQVITQPNSGGPARPRNTGIDRASGDFVAMCDGDDRPAPDAVAGALRVFAAMPDVDLVWGDFAICDAEGNPTGRRWSDTYTSFREHLEATALPHCYRLPAEAVFAQLLQGLFLGTSSVVIRRQALKQVGPFDESLPNGDDREMWLRLARGGARFVYRDQVAYTYRVRSDSLSQRGYRRIPAMIETLERQLPHLGSGPLRQATLERIRAYRLDYAHGLRRAGLRRQARQVYRQLLAERLTWAGLRGYLLAHLRVGGGRRNP